MNTITTEQLQEVRKVYVDLKGGKYNRDKVNSLYDLIKKEEDDEYKVKYLRRWYNRHKRNI